MVGGRNPDAQLPVDRIERLGNVRDARALERVESNPGEQAVDRLTATHNLSDTIKVCVADQDFPLFM